MRHKTVLKQTFLNTYTQNVSTLVTFHLMIILISRAGSLYQCPLTQARGDCSILPGIVPGDTRPPRTDEVCSIVLIIAMIIVFLSILIATRCETTSG